MFDLSDRVQPVEYAKTFGKISQAVNANQHVLYPAESFVISILMTTGTLGVSLLREAMEINSTLKEIRDHQHSANR